MEFIAFLEKILKNKQDNYSVYEQLDRSSTSICLTIAEGTGKYTLKIKTSFMILRVVCLWMCRSLKQTSNKKLITEN